MTAATASKGPSRRTGILAWVPLLLMAAAFFHLSVGRGFIFEYASNYRPLGIVIAVICFPLLAVRCWYNIHIRERFPTSWLRYLIVCPLVAGIGAGCIAIAPIGVAGAYTLLLGEPIANVRGYVTQVDGPRSHRKGCPQFIMVDIEKNSLQLCVENVVAGQVPETGDVVSVSGKSSRLGFLIRSIERQ